MNTARLSIFIATPLEPEHVERIRSVAPDSVEVIAEPDLWPPRRYVADHKGPASFVRTAEQEVRWRRHLARAEVLWDFPPPAADGSGTRLHHVETMDFGHGVLGRLYDVVAGRWFARGVEQEVNEIARLLRAGERGRGVAAHV